MGPDWQGLERWRPEVGNPLLLEELGRQIEQQGRITFAEFMGTALYHPSEGYYTSRREKVGGRGDFYTSPEVHPAFGALLASQMREMWLLLGRPDPFTIVEAGAGSGLLALDVLRTTAALDLEFSQSVQYVIVEISPDLAERQRELLADWAEKVSWHRPPLSALKDQGFAGCLLANEVLDAFPVHLVVMEEGRLREVYVTAADGRLGEVLGEPSTPEIPAYFQRLGITLAEGYRAEVNLQALDWLGEAAGVLAQGFIVVVDYGYLAHDLYSAARPRGTLLCYHQHSVHEDPYVLVGYQDLTAHVDFSSLIARAKDEGLTLTGYTTQQQFLTNLGLRQYLADLRNLGLSTTEYQSNRLAMEDLLGAEGLGGFKVLVLHKGVGEPKLSGFHPTDRGALARPPLRDVLQRPRLGWGDRSKGGVITGNWDDLLR